MAEVHVSEVAARLIHYGEWIEEQPDPEQQAARAYAVIRGTVDENDFVAVLEQYLQGFAEKFARFVESQIEDRGSTERAARDARDKRDRYLEALHQAASRLVETGGRDAASALQDFTQREAAMADLCAQVARDPRATADEIARRACAEVVRKAEAKGAFSSGNLRREDVIQWARLMMPAAHVAEAHRRVRQGY